LLRAEPGFAPGFFFWRAVNGTIAGALQLIGGDSDPLYGRSWPGAAVPNVRRKQTMENNIGQIGEGLLCGASPTASHRP
jgi:hypothetical protein